MPAPHRATPSPSPHRRGRRWRYRFIRLVALLTGVAAIAGLAGSVAIYRQIDAAERTARGQLDQIGEQFTQIAATLATVESSAANAATSVDQAGTALTDAAKTTREFAAALDETAAIINFSVPGLNFRPLDGLDTNFREQAGQLRDLATQVDRTNTTLGQNSRDLRAISGDVALIAREMGDISAQLRQFSSGPDSSLATITNGTRLLIAWSGVIHLLLLAIAASLFLLTIEDDEGSR